MRTSDFSVEPTARGDLSSVGTILTKDFTIAFHVSSHVTPFDRLTYFTSTGNGVVSILAFVIVIQRGKFFTVLRVKMLPLMVLVTVIRYF